MEALEDLPDGGLGGVPCTMLLLVAGCAEEEVEVGAEGGGATKALTPPTNSDRRWCRGSAAVAPSRAASAPAA